MITLLTVMPLWSAALASAMISSLAAIAVVHPQNVTALYIAHPFLAGVVTLWLLSAAVAALPVPTAKSSQLYTTIFRALQLVVAELRGFIKLRFPSAPLPPDPTAPQANVLQMPSPEAAKPTETPTNAA